MEFLRRGSSRRKTEEIRGQMEGCFIIPVLVTCTYQFLLLRQSNLNVVLKVGDH